MFTWFFFIHSSGYSAPLPAFCASFIIITINAVQVTSPYQRENPKDDNEHS